MKTVMLWLPLMAMMMVQDAVGRSDQRVRGFATAVDGDTLLFGEAEVHLNGLDAPELDQTCRKDGQVILCGELSRDALARLIDGKKVSCKRVVLGSRYDAVCRAGGVDLTRELLKTGWAQVNYQQSNFYAGYQSLAKRKQLNLWSMELQPPWEWRQSQNEGVDPEMGERQRCIRIGGSWKC